MRTLCVISCVLLLAPWAAGAEPPKEVDVEKAIREFEPLWFPPKGELRGWTVGIDPGGLRCSWQGACVCQDVGLVTAAHLYHLVMLAGGSPVLTRADDTRVWSGVEKQEGWGETEAARHEASQQHRIDLIRETDCDLCVIIRFNCRSMGVSRADPRPRKPPPLPTKPARVVPGATRSDSRLAQALSRHTGAELGAPPQDCEGFLAALQAAPGTGAITAAEVHWEVAYSPHPDMAKLDVTTRKYCFAQARKLYDAIAAFCTTPGGGRQGDRDPVPVPDTPASDKGSRVARTARKVWPAGDLPLERLDWFCQRYAAAAITNASLVYFEVTAERYGDTVVLRGATNTPPITKGLRRALTAVGVEKVRSKVRALPDRQRLGNKLFGACRVSEALTFAEAGVRSGLQSQLLLGEPVFLLDEVNGHYLLHAGDGYWGWVDADAIEPMTAAEFDAYLALPRGVAEREISAALDGSYIGKPDIRIPRGALLAIAADNGDERTVLLPNGRELKLPAADVARYAPKPDPMERIAEALELLYTPYVFGGRSPRGLDCSGLITNVWARGDQTPARDAWQQALSGRLVATAWHRSTIRPGDVLYFINYTGKVYHTAIALNETYYVHSAPPCVQISSFDPDDPLYEQANRQFFIAKRP